ncbi:protein FAR1-RELATED SEQUENCE 5-like [Salvia divinorum]|uniref:Protein FAR1-RELATED SEQUENCE 5-like n=1 Tax=Salvia divinorum TaxID=28513 RepID=A0ABD1FPF3_SALDI
MFGDVVAFDTTYSTNRYCMVFDPFTGKDNHCCPVAFGAGFAVHGGLSGEHSSGQDSFVDNKQKQINRSHMIYFRLLQRSESKIDDVIALANALERVEEQLFGDCGPLLPSTDNDRSIENIYGAARPDVITAHPPNVVKTKGSGSRQVSKKEAAIRRLNKPGRRCAKCHELGNHDSRNCLKIKEKLKKK